MWKLKKPNVLIVRGILLSEFSCTISLAHAEVLSYFLDFWLSFYIRMRTYSAALTPRGYSGIFCTIEAFVVWCASENMCSTITLICNLFAYQKLRCCQHDSTATFKIKCVTLSMNKQNRSCMLHGFHITLASILSLQ